MHFALIRRLCATKRILLLFIITVISVSLLGCDPRSGEYPGFLSDEWVCEELPFVLSYDIGSDGIKTSSHVLQWQNKPICVRVAMLSSQYDVYPHDSTTGESVLFSGEWRYKGEKLILTINRDNFFGDGRTALEFVPAEKEKTQNNTVEITVSVEWVKIVELKDGMYLAIKPWKNETCFHIPGNVSSNVDLEALRTIRSGDRISVRMDANKKDYLDTAEFIKIYSLATEEKTIFTIDDYNNWISETGDSSAS